MIPWGMSSKPGSDVSFARELRDALGAIQMAMEVLRHPPDEATRVRMITLMERQLATLRALADRCDSAPSPGAAMAEEAATRRVLVVDDNIDSAEVLGTLLEQLGHEVFVAYTGARAIEVAHAVLYVASQECSYLNGTIIHVDGGASVGARFDGSVVDDDPRYDWITGRTPNSQASQPS